MKYPILTVALLMWLIAPVTITPSYAHEGHAHKEGHAHDDGDEHTDHGEEEDPHDDHGHDHDEHEEGATEISPDAAKQAGVVVEKVSPATIATLVPLTGRIVLDENTKANVRARFAGIIRSVKVNLGEKVEKGQVLAVVESNESLQDYNITAPISGVILERNTNIGDVANGQALFTIADLSEVWAKFHVFPKDADIIKAGQSVRVHTLDEGRVGKAKIGMLFPTADALSQTLVAIAPLPNQNGLWRPGMIVEGDVSVSQKQVPLAVRASALQTMEDQKVVFVVEGNRYEMKPVKTGITDGAYVEIKSGLHAGQSYVAEGSFIIKADILKAGAEHQH